MHNLHPIFDHLEIKKNLIPNSKIFNTSIHNKANITAIITPINGVFGENVDADPLCL